MRNMALVGEQERWISWSMFFQNIGLAFLKMFFFALVFKNLVASNKWNKTVPSTGQIVENYVLSQNKYSLHETNLLAQRKKINAS